MLNALDEPVRSIAAYQIIAAEQSDTLRVVAEKMVEASCSALLVECDRDHHAIITEHDVLVAIAAGADPDDQRAVDVMSRDVQEVKPDSSIADTADLMRLAGIRHVLVRGNTGRMGVVSIRDLLDPLLDC